MEKINSKKNIEKYIKNKYTSNSLKDILKNKSFELNKNNIQKYIIHEYIKYKKNKA
jgi:hypothetical protein